MGGSLNQPSRVEDVGPTGRELLLPGGNGRRAPPPCKYPANKHRLTPCQQPR